MCPVCNHKFSLSPSHPPLPSLSLFFSLSLSPSSFCSSSPCNLFQIYCLILNILRYIGTNYNSSNLLHSLCAWPCIPFTICPHHSQGQTQCRVIIFPVSDQLPTVHHFPSINTVKRKAQWSLSCKNPLWSISLFFIFYILKVYYLTMSYNYVVDFAHIHPHTLSCSPLNPPRALPTFISLVLLFVLLCVPLGLTRAT